MLCFRVSHCSYAKILHQFPTPKACTAKPCQVLFSNKTNNFASLHHERDIKPKYLSIYLSNHLSIYRIHIIFIYVYIRTYLHTYIHTHVYIYVYMHICLTMHTRTTWEPGAGRAGAHRRTTIPRRGPGALAGGISYP